MALQINGFRLDCLPVDWSIATVDEKTSAVLDDIPSQVKELMNTKLYKENNKPVPDGYHTPIRTLPVGDGR
jgi:hypothetical protein